MSQYVDFKRQLIQRYDNEDARHEACLRALFEMIMTEEGKNTVDSNLTTEDWTKFGFQQRNPRTDFRAGGLLSLMSLIYIAKF